MKLTLDEVACKFFVGNGESKTDFSYFCFECRGWSILLADFAVQMESFRRPASIRRCGTQTGRLFSSHCSVAGDRTVAFCSRGGACVSNIASGTQRENRRLASLQTARIPSLYVLYIISSFCSLPGNSHGICVFRSDVHSKHRYW